MTIIEAILAVFGAIGDWMVEFIPSFFGLFYVAETGLTLLGSLAVVGLAISVCFLAVGIIQKFLHFRG